MLRGELSFSIGLARLGGDTGMEMFTRKPRKGVRESEFGSGSVHSNIFFSGQGRTETHDRSSDRSDNIDSSKDQSVGVEVWLCVCALR